MYEAEREQGIAAILKGDPPPPSADAKGASDDAEERRLIEYFCCWRIHIFRMSYHDDICVTLLPRCVCN